ncbi:hypothetical protein FACS1894172_15730 [Spirochaetia bacterium]|nr:hypothetical protein FACS1894164_09580 [Spirochaetia bacterium]GHU34860.1 hypothetical protein FACS1894172_15730 [Spirochaetia bacterium]
MKKFYVVFVAVFLLPAALPAQQKYALVIGNSAYNSNIGRLNNPENDANDMAAALTGLGFQVDKILNGSLNQMESAVLRLTRQLSTNANAYGFFFYAGHGVQSGGDNYLIPVDADIQSESLLKERAMVLRFILDNLNEAEDAFNIVVLDACRNNPFTDIWVANSGAQRGMIRGGLSPVTSQPSGTIIAYGAGSGEQASDGSGRNGLYTSQLLKNLATPNLSVRDIFDITSEAVQQISNKKQNPVIFNSAPGARNIYFNRGSTPAPAPAVAALQVPRNVRAGTPGTDSVQLTWDSAGVGISYKVYYNTQNNASSANALGDSTTGTSFNVNGMAQNSTYYFWVSSLQNGRESEKSPVVTVRTASAPVPVQPSIPANFVRIPGGTFTMGSPLSEVDRDSSEVQHRVTITGFSMSKYEVTQEEWSNVMEMNPSDFKGYNLPVERVSWYDAIDYCNARSRKEGLTPAYTIDKSREDPNNNAPTNSEYDWDNDTVRWVVTWNRSANGYRLPTEAEWEYACRAGTTTPFSTGTNITTNQANYNGDSPYNGNAKGAYRGRTWAVGSGTANSWGLYDMHGNVYEWCWDWYGDYSTASQADPAGAASGSERALRGGCWLDSARFLRSAERGGSTPMDRLSISGLLGFRVVLPAGMDASGDRVVQNGTLTASTVTAGTLRVSGTDVNQSANVSAGGTFSGNFAAGTYSVSMTYSDGYVETRSVTITGNVPSTENFSYRPTPVTGTLTASAITAGTWRVTGAGVNQSGYVSAGGTFSETLAAGTYSVTITYSDGKTETQSLTITGNQTSRLSFSYRAAPTMPANFVRIPGGTFTMGSPSSEVNRDSDEIQHRVTITGFSMSKYEVTQEEWSNVMGTNPSNFKGYNLPVENVSWYDAIEYCNARSRKEGLTPAYSRSGDSVTWNRSANGYRLPTEAEWEYACRAGTTTPFSTGTNITTNQANYDGNYPYNGNAKGSYRRQTWAVGSGTANTWGLYDMHGNVWEWCWDGYGDYSTASQADPTGAASGALRVRRGGGWYNGARGLRSALRGNYSPTSRDNYLGFRVVLP